jgi:ureidoacrylate peracid hydrolase
MASTSAVVRHLDPATTGLVVVDAQKAFASSEGSLAERGVDVSAPEATVPAVVDLVDFARGADVPVFYTGSERRADGTDDPAVRYDLLPDVYDPETPVCRTDSTDVEYVDGIDPAPGEYEIRKRRYDAFFETPLETYLRIEDVETVLICGFVTHGCVEMTARSAHERGFDVVLVEDCAASFDDGDHEATVRTVNSILGASVTLDDVRDGLT